MPVPTVKSVPAFTWAAPPLTANEVMLSVVPDLAAKPVLALAAVTATEPVKDSVFTLPFKLVNAPVPRLPEDLSKTAAPPDTAPVVSVPPVTSRSTVPALLVTAPTLLMPTASRVMLPLAVPLVPVKVLPAVKVAEPALTV